MKIDQLLPASGFVVVARGEHTAEFPVHFFALVEGKILPVVFRDAALVVATEGELSKR